MPPAGDSIAPRPCEPWRARARPGSDGEFTETTEEAVLPKPKDDAIVLERTIDVHIRALRKKMGRYADLVQTVRGIGYRLRDPADIVNG